MKEIFIIPFLLGVTYAVHVTECNSNAKGLYLDAWCLRNNSKERGSCNNDALKITWDYGNKDKGEIFVNILGQMCDVMNYGIKLLRYSSNVGISDPDNKEIILHKGKNYSRNGIISHSLRRINEENPYEWNSNLPSCDQMKYVTFNFVYSGCYMLIVKNISVIDTYFSDPICFNTTFMQESVYQQNIKVFSQYVKDMYVMKHIIVTNFSSLQINKMFVEIWKSDHKFMHCRNATEKVHHQKIILKPSGIACLSPFGVIPCRWEEDNDRIECSMFNITDGYYCFMVTLDYDPCNYKSSVWQDKKLQCRFSGAFESANPAKKEIAQHHVPSGDSRVIIVMMFMILVFTAVIVIVVFILYRKWSRQIKRTDEFKKKSSPDIVKVNIDAMPVRPQIYLMYSHDCEPFMEVMKIFRCLLKDVFKCEVYDCFDPDCFEDMAKIGLNWPGKLIENENVRVVLVETKCAKLHLEAHKEHFKIAYQNPTPWDDYFMCGVKAIMHNPKYNSYDKLFIARVHGFTSEEDKLMEITPYTRYDIPDALYHLLSSILQQFHMIVPNDWNHNIHKLQEAIKNLENYYKNNENYLEKFILKREIHGLRKFISRFKNN